MAGLVAPVADEREGLLAYLAQQRYAVRLATHGITDEQARAAAALPSSLTLGGIVKHLAAVERFWAGVARQQVPQPGDGPDYEGGFRMGPDETLAGLLADYEGAAGETDDLVRSAGDMGQPVPVPPGVPWFPDDVDHWSIRWLVLHLVEETARHAGHADIVREALDGATAFPLMAAVEDWPDSPWIRKWAPQP